MNGRTEPKTTFVSRRKVLCITSRYQRLVFFVLVGKACEENWQWAFICFIFLNTIFCQTLWIVRNSLRPFIMIFCKMSGLSSVFWAIICCCTWVTFAENGGKVAYPPLAPEAWQLRIEIYVQEFPPEWQWSSIQTNRTYSRHSRKEFKQNFIDKCYEFEYNFQIKHAILSFL